MRNHHPQPGPRRRVQPQEDVEEPQRHHPGHARRDGLPQAHLREEHPALRDHLEAAHHHRPARLRRRLRQLGDDHPLRGNGGAHVHARPGGRRGLAENRRLQGSGDPAGHPQHRRVDPEFRQGLFCLRPLREDRSVVQHEGHRLQDLRRAVPRHLPAGVRGKLEGDVRGGGNRVLLHPHRRRGRTGHPVRRGIPVGPARTTTATSCRTSSRRQAEALP